MAPLAVALPVIATVGKVAAIGGMATSLVGAATGNKKLQKIGGIVGLAGAGASLGTGVISGAMSGAGSSIAGQTASQVAGSVTGAGAASPLSLANGASGALSNASTSSLLSSSNAVSAPTVAGTVGSSGTTAGSIGAASGATAGSTASDLGLSLSSSSGSGIDTAAATSVSKGTLIRQGAVEGVKATMKDNATAIKAGSGLATTATGIASSISASNRQRQQLEMQQQYYDQQVATQKAAKVEAYTTAKQNRAKAAAYGYTMSNYSTSLNNLYSGSYDSLSGSTGLYVPTARKYSLLG